MRRGTGGARSAQRPHQRHPKRTPGPHQHRQPTHIGPGPAVSGKRASDRCHCPASACVRSSTAAPTQRTSGPAPAAPSKRTSGPAPLPGKRMRQIQHSSAHPTYIGPGASNASVRLRQARISDTPAPACIGPLVRGARHGPAPGPTPPADQHMPASANDARDRLRPAPQKQPSGRRGRSRLPHVITASARSAPHAGTTPWPPSSRRRHTGPAR